MARGPNGEKDINDAVLNNHPDLVDEAFRGAKPVNGEKEKTKSSLITYDEAAGANPNTEQGAALIKAYRKQEREAFNARYGMLMIEGKPVVVYRERNGNTGEIETKFSSPEAMATFTANRKIPFVVETGKESRIEWKPIFQDWKQGRWRRSYDQPVFAPAANLEASTDMPPAGGTYNLYAGHQFKPKPGNCERILQHIGEVWCAGNSEAFDYIVNWLARMVQKPREQGRTVIVLRSGEGTGKNILFDTFSRYYGNHACMLTKPEDLVGFNDHLATAVFVFLNEALWGGNRSAEGPVKSAITDDTLMVERKWVPKFKTANCTHIVVATNNDWAVPVGIDDRRFLILDLDEKHKGDAAYFDGLLREIHNGGQEAFIHYLMARDITRFDVRAIPEIQSASKLDHKVRTSDPITQWWIDTLTDGEFAHEIEDTDTHGRPVRRVAVTAWPMDKPLIIEEQAVFNCYCRAHRSRHLDSKAVLTKKLRELCPGLRTGLRHRTSASSRPRLYGLPALSTAREAMELRLRQRGPWADEADQ
ncbi:hypothetical protein THITH_01545 [Thioalkalivibrio paradoxus ARh 1]|uniref:NrS-1 polymerase-like helicase domain-containing protein n=1 Tax=Thioalkalivibrio paradoxus ARh 1 TaxID=713585 RepID=W0DRF5_9GAMM|nr:hypothetical protein THITH_01545 [Thioalkalivibrio paradoxus ARh 1]